MTTNTAEANRRPARGREAFRRNWQFITEQLRARLIEHFAVPEGHGYKIGIPRSSFPHLKRMLCRLSATPGIIVEYQLRRRWYRYLPLFSPDRIMRRRARYRIFRRTRQWGRVLFGAEFSCVIEVWDEHAGRLECQYGNKIASRIPDNSPKTMCELDSVTPIHRLHVDKQSALQVGFPVDIVYTWVDGSDQEWRRLRRQYQQAGFQNGAEHPSADDEARYRNRDELRYSLRSVYMYADFFRRIYILTNGQVPDWLNTDYPDIQVVTHSDIFLDAGALPTFNSHAIESQLHHIDGLSEHFVYLNDDVFIGRPLTPEHFFTPNGLARIFPSEHNIPCHIADFSDRPINAANQQTQALVERRFSGYPTHKLQHAPFALKRSVLDRMEKLYAGDFEATACSRFRAPSDISVAASLFAYHALNTLEAVPGVLKARYIDINDPLFPVLIAPFSRLARDKYDTFCLNEIEDGSMPPRLRDYLVAKFVSRRFPDPSPFENTG